MKYRLLLAATVWAANVTAPAAEQEGLTSDLQKFSYAIGLQIGRNLRDQGLTEIDANAVALAVRDMVNGAELRLSIEEMKAAQLALRDVYAAQQQARAADSIVAGKKFLAANREREEIQELEGGVQYKVIIAGQGDTPTATDTVRVHYSGKLLNGQVFDSSYDRGEPAEFKVGQVIRGWQQTLQAMPVGSKWEVWIPAALAYGEKGTGSSIGPNETLNFLIELLTIKTDS